MQNPINIKTRLKRASTAHQRRHSPKDQTLKSSNASENGCQWGSHGDKYHAQVVHETGAVLPDE